MRRHRRTTQVVLAAILILTGCGETKPPVTATKVFAVSGVTEILNSVALSPDGSLVVVADLDGFIVARGVASGAERWRVRAHRAGARRIDSLAFSADGVFLASSGDDAREVELWKGATGYEAGVVPVRDARVAVFHPIDRTLVLGAGPTLHVVDVDKAEVTRTIPNAHLGDLIYAAAFSPDGGSWPRRPSTARSSSGSGPAWRCARR
jgi:WD40 repeat protein